MQCGVILAAAIAIAFSLPGVAVAEALATVSDLDLLFADFSFDAFVQQSLGKPAADLMNADREALAKVRDQDRRETEARYRDLEQSCRAE
jgi:hypothetical protein